jgi:dephospho-CoA kinase
VVIAGLTGGIASGKSTVSAVLAEAGARVIDADRIARDIVRRGGPAYQRIVARFGRQILRPDGDIDRGRLGAVVFDDPQERRALEGIVHPGVREETARRVEQLRREAPDAVVVLDVPLLFESGMHRGLAEVIVVYVPAAVQLERLIKRDSLPKAAALARIRSQMPLDEKKALATRVIDNSGPPEETRRQTLEIYRQLAGKKACPEPC